MNLKEWNSLQRPIILKYRLLSLQNSEEGKEEFNKICEYLSYFKKYEAGQAVSNCMDLVVREELAYFFKNKD